jgi:UDP-GlcNAc:undecaprenyl-phosphate GlcNAc-1-phosphate transferase
MWLAGFRIEHLGSLDGFSLSLGALSLPVTVGWIVAVINAVNLIDGLDGLAAGVALTATLVLLGVALAAEQVLLCLLMVALAGALVGFLVFNFNPARIFLGDSGSLFLGFVLAVASTWTQQKAHAAAAISLIPVFALAVPLLDTALCIVRRMARGQHPFSPDREHLHHRLMALGLSHRGAVLTLWALAGAFALAALELLDEHPLRRGAAVLVALAAAAVLVRKVGLFGVTPMAGKKMVVRARAVAAQVRSAPSLDVAWREVQAILPTLRCEEARLEIREAEDAARVLAWHNGNERGSRRRKPSVLRLPLGRRDLVGDLEVLWSEGPITAPMHAARKKALRSLHVALSDLRRAERRVGSEANAGGAVWSTQPQPAGRGAID